MVLLLSWQFFFPITIHTSGHFSGNWQPKDKARFPTPEDMFLVLISIITKHTENILRDATMRWAGMGNERSRRHDFLYHNMQESC